MLTDTAWPEANGRDAGISQPLIMGRTRYVPPPGASYHLSEILGDKPGSYGETISDLISARCAPEQRVPGAVYLPTRGFCRNLGINTASAGGDLVGSNLQIVADAARPRLLLEQLGAQRIEVSETGNVSVPVWVAGAGSGWVAEDAPAEQLPSAVRSIESSGKMAAARLAISRRLQLMADAVEDAVLAELRSAVASTVESGFLTGTGSSNQPLGIINTPGIGTTTFGAGVPTASELAGMIESFADADGQLANAAWILHPSDVADLLKTDPARVVWIDGTWRIHGIPVHASRNITEGRHLLLDPTETRTIYWGAPQLVVDKFSNGKSISGAADLVVFNLCDVAVTHPAHVVVGSA